jgi:beta-xylosidase
VDWKDEGKMLDVKGDQVKWATGNAWAPCIIEVKCKNVKSKKLNNASAASDYKYYFYYSAHNPQSNRKEIGVAVSDSPTGPFVDSGAPIITDADRPKEARGGQAIDVDVFQDPKTGKCYLYWGNGFMAGAELNDDMLSVKKETITHLTPKGGNLQSWAFREGAYVFYRKGTYYFMWSVDDTGSPNYHVCYGTAKSPLGPITIDENNYMVIKQKPEDKIYGTAHNSVLQIPGKDEWYIVYHRINKHFVNHEPGIHREVCIDRLTFDKQGRIIPVTPTLNGPEPLKTK